MESKNIKIIDEHGIDRVANVVCSIDVDGSDYVIYWIERDNDNDNLFVSKLLKNNDGTSTMMNIEDSIEKNSLTEIVKELITHSINDEKDSIDTNSVELKNGKSVKISSVLFNKEQNINVQKTYITTVKKSVTKVSEKYYHVDSIPNSTVEEVTPFVEPVPSPVVSAPEAAPVEMPSLEETPQPVSEPEIIVPETPVLEVPVQEMVIQPEPISSPIVQNEEIAPIPVIESPSPVQSAPEVVMPVEQSTMAAPVINLEEPNVDARMNIIGANPSPQVEQPVVSATSPVPPVTASAVPVQEVSAPVTPPPVTNNVPDNLFFDGSKETNLEGIFSGNTDDTQPVVATETVAPIREFGQDEPVIPIVNDVQPAVQEQPNTGAVTSSQGFANNKFFMVIALTFFIASCVFLGYEVFKYFQMK